MYLCLSLKEYIVFTNVCWSVRLVHCVKRKGHSNNYLESFYLSVSEDQLMVGYYGPEITSNDLEAVVLKSHRLLMLKDKPTAHK